MHPASLADDSDVKPDMTPMIDCVFLMIVFFICLEFRALEAKLPAWLPRDRGSSPTRAQPVEQLSVRIHCDAFGAREVAAGARGADGRAPRHRLTGHRVHWQVGAHVCQTQDQLRQQLQRLAGDVSLRIPDPKQPGGTRVLPVVIEPLAGAVYADAVLVADLARHAGFDDITFGGGMGALAGR